VSRKFVVVRYLMLLALPVAANAASTGLPWEAPILRFAHSIAGPVAVSCAIALLAMIGVQYAHHGEFSEISRRMGASTIWLGIALAATLVVSTLFLSFGALI